MRRGAFGRPVPSLKASARSADKRGVITRARRRLRCCVLLLAAVAARPSSRWPTAATGTRRSSALLLRPGRRRRPRRDRVQRSRSPATSSASSSRWRCSARRRPPSSGSSRHVVWLAARRPRLPIALVGLAAYAASRLAGGLVMRERRASALGVSADRHRASPSRSSPASPSRTCVNFDRSSSPTRRSSTGMPFWRQRRARRRPAAAVRGRDGPARRASSSTPRRTLGAGRAGDARRALLPLPVPLPRADRLPAARRGARAPHRAARLAAGRRPHRDAAHAVDARPDDRAPLRRRRALHPRDRRGRRAARDEEQDLAHTAGLLHDIGKFILPDHILLADTKLDDEDWQLIRMHPYQGAKVVREVEGYGPVADIIWATTSASTAAATRAASPATTSRSISRMISIADTYDVMTVARLLPRPGLRAEARSRSCAACQRRAARRRARRGLRRACSSQGRRLPPRRRRGLRGRARVRAPRPRLRRARASSPPPPSAPALAPAGVELGHVERRRRARAAPARCSAGARLVEPRGHLGVGEADVAQQQLGVRAQRVRQLAQVAATARCRRAAPRATRRSPRRRSRARLARARRGPPRRARPREELLGLAPARRRGSRAPRPRRPATRSRAARSPSAMRSRMRCSASARSSSAACSAAARISATRAAADARPACMGSVRSRAAAIAARSAVTRACDLSSALDGRAPLRPHGDRAPLAAGVGRRAARGRSPTTTADRRPKSYVLEMLPYPSGEPHIGHLKVYSVGDAVAHFHRRTGRRVLHPMGYDAFGLPAENHAIKTGQHPRDSTERRDRRVPAPVPRVGHLDRLDARVRHARAARTTAGRSGSSCSSSSAGLAYRKEAAVNWCPNDADRARQRAGHRRALRALRRAGRGPPARAVVLPHHRLRRPAARGPRHDRVARARQDDAAQLDRPLRGRRGHVPLRGARHRLPGLHDAPGHAVRRDVLRHGARAPRRAAPRRRHRARGRGARVRQPRARPSPARSAATPSEPKTGVPLGPHGDQPGQRRAAADVRRRLRAHGVRHRRDHGGARRTTSATSRSPRRSTCRSERVGRRAARSCRTPATARSSTRTRTSTGCTTARRCDADRRLARPRGQGPRVGQLPAARLAALPPALLGLPDPDRPLPDVRPGAGARGPAAGRAARRRGLQAEGPLAAGGGRGLGATTTCPRAAAPAQRETDTMDTFVDSSWYFLRYCDAHNDEARVGPARSSTAGCRSTSTSAASSTRSCTCSTRASSARRSTDLGHLDVQEPFARLFTQGMITARRGEDVQVARATSSRRATIVERYGADTARCYILFIGPPDQDADWSRRRASRACTASSARLWRTAAEAADELPDEPAPGAGERQRRRRARAAQGALGDRQGHATTWRGALRVQHRDRRGDGAAQRADAGEARRRRRRARCASRCRPRRRCSSRSRRTSAPTPTTG